MKQTQGLQQPSPAQMGMAEERTQPVPTLRALAFQLFLESVMNFMGNGPSQGQNDEA